MLGDFGRTLDREGLTDLLRRKCELRGISFDSLRDFFTEGLVSEAETHWDSNLRPFVANLPACTEVLGGLRSILPDYFPDLK